VRMVLRESAPGQQVTLPRGIVVPELARGICSRSASNSAPGQQVTLPRGIVPELAQRRLPGDRQLLS
jgi:hypothetical protein